MRGPTLLLALLALLPAALPLATSSHAGGLVDPAAPAPVSAHLSWTDALDSAGFVAACVGACTTVPPPETDCDDGDCDARAVQVHVPAGHWSANAGGFRVTAWSGADGEPEILVRIRDASGTLLAQGSPGPFSVAFLPEPADGTYTVEAQSTFGEGAYELRAFFESRARAGGDVRPNLVTLTPTDVGIAPCGVDEEIEEGATRCLRFSNRVANLGLGPLEVRMGPVDAAAGLAAMGRWTQRVLQENGTFRDQPVGVAEFHAIHGHYHYQGLSHYVVHAYDLATSTRGAAVNDGTKAGFCFIDSGVVDPARAGNGGATYDATSCLLPLDGGDTRMGVSPGWFDLYDAGLAEQYVDLAGVPDGVYELVSTSNPLGTLLESDATDNAASVLFRLTGNAVTVLGPP